MSYARFSNGDVYVFLHSDGYLCCCMCSTGQGSSMLLAKDFQAFTTEEMIEHLKEHVQRGDQVPKHAFEGLEHDAEQNNIWIKRTIRARGGT